MSYRDKIREQKRAAANPVVVAVNSVTPGGYTLKQPAIFDFYEGEYPVDWAAINAANPVRVFFQATYGPHGRHWNDKADYRVADYVEEAIGSGRKYGLYHLLLPHDIIPQADFYCKTVETLGGFGQMPPIVDVEYEPPKGKDTFRGTQWANQVKAWLDILELRSGMKPEIYWSKKYAAFLNDRFGNPPAWMKDYHHLIAGYPWTLFVDLNKTMPRTYMVNGAEDWAAWQYAEDGRYRGKPANDLSLAADWYVQWLISKFGG